MRTVAYVAAYLAAIVIANLTVALFGPLAAVWNALLLIALDLVSRDALHEAWGHGAALWRRMAALIVAGSALSYAAAVLWPGGLPAQLVGGVALASCAAFAGAALVDTVVYAALHGRPWAVRCNLSNAAAALVDTAVFVSLAPVLGPALLLSVGAPLLMAKLAGGLVWSLLLRPRALTEARP